MGLANTFLGKQNSALDVSYVALRRLIGVLGIALPIIVVPGAFLFAGAVCKESISAYYHSCMRDFFVALLGLLGAFLITYKGFDRLDHAASSLAGAAAIGVALFPNNPGSAEAGGKFGTLQLTQPLSDHLHTVSAAVLFITLALISLFLFTKTSSPAHMTAEKKKRNKLYRVCGVVMLCALSFIALCWWRMNDGQKAFWRPTLLGETVALLAFGTSWLVKGETFLKDKDR